MSEITFSEEQKQALIYLDKTSIDAFTGSRVVDIIGVITGVKPAAYLEDMEEILPIIKPFTLSYVPIGAKEGVIARLDSTAYELVTYMKERRMAIGGDKMKKDTLERKIGALLGYPVSATEYFIKRWDMDPLPPFVRPLGSNVPNEYYINLVLSPENYQEELRTYIRPLEKATKQFAPKTHELFERLSNQLTN